MARLSTIDAGFLYAETPESPMHVAGLHIFEPPRPGANVFESYRDHIAARLHLLPLDVGVIACRAAVPDVQILADLLVEEFAVLQRAAAKGTDGATIEDAADTRSAHRRETARAGSTPRVGEDRRREKTRARGARALRASGSRKESP